MEGLLLLPLLLLLLIYTVYVVWQLSDTVDKARVGSSIQSYKNETAAAAAALILYYT